MLRSIIILTAFLLMVPVIAAAQDRDTTASEGQVIERVIFENPETMIDFMEHRYSLTSTSFADTLRNQSRLFTETEERPERASLSQNYPNPFNPATTIGFRLSENSNVKIEVFDQLGRSVDVLLQGTRSAGEHTVAYDASHLTSGIYIYRMEMQSLESSNRQMFTRKFTLLK
ncbi:T9SS C-terminal target domain-containing protein [Rhodohalobacter sp. SW132]|uniref:T9SS type A sorting domain-containing protein n=1 Tax=Rhodohalobacter sp. SW132 TaxID=2293433 RepID=UPI000E261111|nr:T9SS type A sorting domain-containing protein [Rhodohalobacter sp. SW132]REL37698.1 T9SS C-terminal target domain-containing protein [Rhodohalobacter sp. SW132]